MTTVTCEAVAQAAIGPPLKREGQELLYRRPHPERHQHQDQHPSLKINPKKDVWMCAPCGGKGKGWVLAAFIADINPKNKKAVAAWLVEKELLPKAKRKAKPKADGRGPCVATYVYTDADGNPIARKLRFEPGANGKKKDFAWERWHDGRWLKGLGENGNTAKVPLYRLPRIKDEPMVVDTEGEKDADESAKIDLPTTTSGGTGSWREDHSEALRSKDVVIVADADEPGRKDAQEKAASLYDKAASVKVVEIFGVKDLTEAIQAGWTRDRLISLFTDAPEWKPATGAEILDLAMTFICRFVRLTVAQARAVALWIAHNPRYRRSRLHTLPRYQLGREAIRQDTAP